MTTESTWHLGYIIGVPIIAVLALIALAVAVVSTVKWLGGKGYYAEDWALGTILGGIFALILGGLTFALAFPFDTSYHRYYKVSGQVEQIQHRLIKAGNGMAERYVFVIDGKPYAVDDTRATLTKKGDHVSLWCSKEYQYMGDSGWACEWGVAR